MTSTLVQTNRPAMFSSPALGSGLVILDDDGEAADIGEVFLIPPAIGLSRRLINRDHHEVYYADVPRDPGGRTLRRHGDLMQRVTVSHVDGTPSKNVSPQPYDENSVEPDDAVHEYYRALGRADDTMNLSGIKVGTTEIERTVSDISGIREVAAVAVSPPEGGPGELVIFVAAEADAVASPKKLLGQMQTLVRTRLNPLFKIHQVVLLDQLPRTASNKIMRRTLRETWLRQRKE